MKIEGNTLINNTGGNSSSQSNTQGKRSMEDTPVKELPQGSKGSFPGEDLLIEMIERSNQDLQMNNSSLKFSIHEKTKQILVKIVDNDTKEVIREIPSEKILDMVAAMLERTGVFLDKKA